MTSLLVAIHDVTPAHDVAVRRLRELVREVDIHPALFVVPDWHGRWPLAAHPAFVDWLRRMRAAGSDILLHGERHDEAGLPRQWRDEWRALGRTAREGEFLTLGYLGARQRIARGLQLLRRLELAPLGFVAPAWLARDECVRAAADEGLAISEDASRIRLLASGVVMHSPVIRWSARSGLRALASVLLAVARRRRVADRALVRIALHPADLSSPCICRSIVRTLARLGAGARHLTYTQLAEFYGGVTVRG
jgi:hypothetical protein